MQAKLSQNEIINILGRLKVALNATTDTELAEALGVRQNTISTWKTRGSLDFPLIISKCDNIDLNWLFTGRGNMVRDEQSDSSQSQTVIHERDPRDIQLIATQEDLIKALKRQVRDLESRGFRTEDLTGAQSVDIPITPPALHHK